MNRRSPTSHDVARAAGVSQSAVSRAFTPGASVSPEMRARIDEAASALGYRPSRLPGIMRKGRSGIVAIVTGGAYNPFHAMTQAAFIQALATAGRQAMLVQVDSDRDIDEAVGDLLSLNIDGVLSALSIGSPRLAERLDRHRLPIVTLNSVVESEWVRSVRSDNQVAGYEAASLLHASGSRRFASIMGPADTYSHGGRAAGLATALVDRGMDRPLMLHGGYDHYWGREAATQLLSLAERPDGLFCGNDMIAAGVVDRWAEDGLTAPRDYRIIGFDDIPIAAWPHYALTTFDQNCAAQAALAVDLLEQSDARPQTPRAIAPMVVRRKSC